MPEASAGECGYSGLGDWFPWPTRARVVEHQAAIHTENTGGGGDDINHGGGARRPTTSLLVPLGRLTAARTWLGTRSLFDVSGAGGS